MSDNDNKEIKSKYDLSKFNIYEVLEKYKPSDDIFDDTDPKIQKIKKIIYTKLDETERRIILSYAEIENVRDTARLFKVSPTTIWLKIKDIRNKVKDYYFGRIKEEEK